MITQDAIDSAYAFFHQKWRVYEFSHSDRQKDDIEYAISSYVDQMDRDLYERLAHGREAFLQDHTTFPEDMQEALKELSAAVGT